MGERIANGTRSSATQGQRLSRDRSSILTARVSESLEHAPGGSASCSRKLSELLKMPVWLGPMVMNRHRRRSMSGARGATVLGNALRSPRGDRSTLGLPCCAPLKARNSRVASRVPASLISNYSSNPYGVGRGCGVGRGLGVALGVAVGVGEGVGVGVTGVGVGVGVVGVGVGVGVAHG